MDKLAIQSQIAGSLQAAGYHHIGLDHYVLPSDDLARAQAGGRLQRNFQGYSVQLADDLVGLGVSSISQIGDYYVQNARQIEHYYDSLCRGELPVHRGYRTSGEDRLRRHVIMELICNLHLDLNECEIPGGESFWEHFQREAATLRQMAGDGLLELDDGAIRVTERGRPFLRNVCMVFDQYLGDREEAANAPRYSAVV
jgi:oxygen-independent coproporphyrinogen-3 oxidase